VADVRPVELAEIDAVPARVSLYLKLALFVPEAIVTVVIVAVSALLRNVPPGEPVTSDTVTSDAAFVAVPVEVCSCTVITPEVTPAVSAWATVVKANVDADETTVRVALSLFPVKVAVTVCAPEDVAVQDAVALLHDPSGEIAKVVDPVTFPRPLLNWSKAVTA